MSTSRSDSRSPQYPSDGDLLDLLREGLTSGVDVPASVYAAGYAAYTWRTIDLELAALAYDSAFDLAGAGTRAAADQATVRSMTFTTDSVAIDIEIGDGEVMGQISHTTNDPVDPPRAISVETDDAHRDYPVNPVGGFAISPVPTGRFRLVVSGGGHPVATGWITL